MQSKMYRAGRGMDYEITEISMILLYTVTPRAVIIPKQIGRYGLIGLR